MQSLKIVKRSGDVVEFDRARIRGAVQAAVRATGEPIAEQRVDNLTDAICQEVESRFVDFYPNVENVQDIVEKHLMLQGLFGVAKAYILYRADRQKARDEARERNVADARLGRLTVVKQDGRTMLFNVRLIEGAIRRAAQGYEAVVDVDLVVREAINNVYDGIPTSKIEQAMILATTAYIERDVAYSYVASRLLLQKLTKEVVGRSTRPDDRDAAYRASFREGIQRGVEARLYDPRLAERFDLDRLAAALEPERDLDLQYLGMQTLYERYFLRRDGVPAELPQAFWMRVAMGLAVLEAEPTERAMAFYALMSQRRFVPSTPTLFHAGTLHPQLSSCYLTTIDDELQHIFKCYADNSQLSKWSGGIGNDWSNIRGTGAAIASTKVESQGVIPFLKIANDVTMAINRSGKRRGATCAYLETWHYDIEDFLDLRKNTGDDRRRTHDMNTANWIPDLFMKRVLADGPWTLFSTDEVPDLHHLYGRAFETAYEAYEAKARRGEMSLFKILPAAQLWRKMLTMLFETGHPWITFKDPCNIRSPQDHAGVVHCSNLCTEITLNTSDQETAVCNLGSVNLAHHVGPDGQLDEARLAETVRVAMRMLDNVVDICYYPTVEAERSNLRHRPVGLGVMGLQDLLFRMDIPFGDRLALDTGDQVMEFISLHAIMGSSQLAAERGAYASFKGSKWDRGIFPLDTLDLLERERGVPVDVSRESRLDWRPVREHVARHGMRNSNTMAVAPTATIANIAGCFPSIEPIYKNLYVKANISGEFTVVNHYLVEDLKALGLWDLEMLDKLKYCDGNIALIPEIPERLRDKYKEAFDIDPIWALRLAAARGKWIDQSQSHNVFIKGTSGKLLSEVYLSAWRLGLKTTYYLRTLAASQIEKSTLDAGRFGYTQKREYGVMAAEEAASVASAASAAAVSDLADAGLGRMPVLAVEHHGAPVSATGQVMTALPVSTLRDVALASAAEPASVMTMTATAVPTVEIDGVRLCRIDDPDCEACQ